MENIIDYLLFWREVKNRISRGNRFGDTKNRGEGNLAV